ncbi:unnamed protein product [Somion occarium]|uniref:DUF6534 domain-containing protein n=1 Tax=Somion occarium TaxID=3059160 RepID=A0ABP1CYN2_9APHY
MQVFLYYKFYSRDPLHFRLLVALTWVSDLVHTGMACSSNWSYLIGHFGDEQIIDSIIWPITVTIALTAIIIFFVQSFLAYRIFTLSKRNWIFTTPIAALAVLRLATALVSTSKMIQLKRYSLFVESISWVFTLSLSLGTAVDVLITVTLCWYLNQSRTGFKSMETIIDSIMLYTIETGLLTSVMTVLSLICWLTMSHNLIFLGLHFAISKLYANMLLATLNARKIIRKQSDYSMSVVLPNNRHRFGPRAESPIPPGMQSPAKTVEICVEESVHNHVDAYSGQVHRLRYRCDEWNLNKAFSEIHVDRDQ